MQRAKRGSSPGMLTNNLPQVFPIMLLERVIRLLQDPLVDFGQIKGRLGRHSL